MTNREDFLWASLGTPEFEINPRPWTSPECSPLLPPPRVNSIQRRSPPSPVNVTQASPPPVRRRGSGRSRARTTEILGSVLGTYPKKEPRALPGTSIENRILSRTPPPPPTPAKSWAQRERARMPLPSLVAPLPTPVGFVAELEGSIVKVRDVSGAGIVSGLVLDVEDKPRKRNINPSKIKSSLSPPKYKIPEGKEIYAYLPLPAVPSPSRSRSPSPTPSRTHKSSESSPVIDIQLGIGDGDGLVQWFENFRWGEGLSSPSLSPGTPGKRDSNICILPLSGKPRTPRSTESTFSVWERVPALNPDDGVRNGEQPGPALSPGTNNMAKNTGFLTPAYLASPRLASCHGSRSSFASSAGDAFRFDLEVGEALSDVDEGHEEGEADANELYQISPVKENTGILGQEVFGGWGLGVGRLYEDKDRDLKGGLRLRGDDGLDVDELYKDVDYEGDDNGSDTSNEFDSRLEQEIEMILNGTYGGGSSDDWRDGIYSADNSSLEQDDDEWDGEIIVGLDIDMEMMRKVDVRTKTDEVMGDEDGWSERPRTRYIAGRNSMLDSDVIFCLRGIDSM